jgi:hypothetical protein
LQENSRYAKFGIIINPAMKKLILIFALFPFLTSLRSVPHTSNYSSGIPDGFYVGSDKLFTLVFLKISNDTAFVDFIHVEKFPRSLYSDTLLHDQATETWKGKTSRLYKKRQSYFVATTGSNTEVPTTKKNPVENRIKIKANEIYYKQHADVKRNAAVWRKTYEDFLNTSDNDPGKLEALQNKFELENLIRSLPHPEFMKIFEKFKAELEGK